MLYHDACKSWARLDPFIEGFEHSMLAQGSAEIVDFLPDAGDELYVDVLVELVRIDLEFHWRSGQPKMVEEYLPHSRPWRMTARGWPRSLTRNSASATGPGRRRPPMNTCAGWGWT